MNRHRIAVAAIGLGLVLGVLGPPLPARAHCDGMDGPVVRAAKEALEKGEVNRVLHWVKAEGEAEVREAFAKTLAVRALGAEARDLADLRFFETLVRVHRAGEGEPFTGVKPAGRDLGPAIPAADRALEEGSVDALVKLLQKEVEGGVRERFRHAREVRAFKPGDVAAGREFVEAYVGFVHYAEGVHLAATAPAATHGEPAEEGHGGHHGGE